MLNTMKQIVWIVKLKFFGVVSRNLQAKQLKTGKQWPVKLRHADYIPTLRALLRHGQAGQSPLEAPWFKGPKVTKTGNNYYCVRA